MTRIKNMCTIQLEKEYDIIYSDLLNEELIMKKREYHDLTSKFKNTRIKEIYVYFIIGFMLWVTALFLLLYYLNYII